MCENLILINENLIFTDITFKKITQFRARLEETNYKNRLQKQIGSQKTGVQVPVVVTYWLCDLDKPPNLPELQFPNL